LNTTNFLWTKCDTTNVFTHFVGSGETQSANPGFQPSMQQGLGSVEALATNGYLAIAEIGNSDTGGTAAARGPFYYLANNLQRRFNNGGAGWVSFNSSQHPQPLGASAQVTKVGSGGNWNTFGGNVNTLPNDCGNITEPCGPDLTQVNVTTGMTGGPDTAQVTCKVANEIDLYYGKGVGYGSFNWNINGGGNTPVNEANASKSFGVVKATGLVEGNNTMNVILTSDSEVVLLGAVCIDTVKQGVRVDNLGLFSALAQNFVDNPLEGAELASLGNQTVGLNFGTIEFENTIALATYTSNLTSLLSTINSSLPNSDVYIASPWDSNPTCTAGGCGIPLGGPYGYEGVNESFAKQNNLGFFDYRKTFSNYTKAASLPNGLGSTVNCYAESLPNPIHLSGPCSERAAEALELWLTNGIYGAQLGNNIGPNQVTQELGLTGSMSFGQAIKIGSTGQLTQCGTSDATIESFCLPNRGVGLLPSTAQQCIIGTCPALFDNSATAGHCVGISTSVVGDFTDLGANTCPPGPLWIVGRVAVGGGNSGAGTVGYVNITNPQFMHAPGEVYNTLTSYTLTGAGDNSTVASTITIATPTADTWYRVQVHALQTNTPASCTGGASIALRLDYTNALGSNVAVTGVNNLAMWKEDAGSSGSVNSTGTIVLGAPTNATIWDTVPRTIKVKASTPLKVILFIATDTLAACSPFPIVNFVPVVEQL
jgi:hypothetical protein